MTGFLTASCCATCNTVKLGTHRYARLRVVENVVASPSVMYGGFDGDFLVAEWLVLAVTEVAVMLNVRKNEKR